MKIVKDKYAKEIMQQCHGKTIKETDVASNWIKITFDDGSVLELETEVFYGISCITPLLKKG